MLNLRKGRYLARFAVTEADLHAAQALRYRAFFGGGVDFLPGEALQTKSQTGLIPESLPGQQPELGPQPPFASQSAAQLNPQSKGQLADRLGLPTKEPSDKRFAAEHETPSSRRFGPQSKGQFADRPALPSQKPSDGHSATGSETPPAPQLDAWAKDQVWPRDQDRFDPRCRHVLIEDGDDLVGCFRLLELASGAEIAASYSAQFYDLSLLRSYPGALLEMGRFCLAPNRHDPDILRLAWGAVARLVDAGGVKLLFGCSSFPGVDAGAHHLAFAELARRHLAPAQWAPKQLTALAVPLANRIDAFVDPLSAARAMPPLLRSYLALGGWVSDHAVIDPQMNTLHVFTGVEIDKVPPARARLLRAVAS